MRGLYDRDGELEPYETVLRWREDRDPASCRLEQLV
jgi:hypothetical protein